MCTFQTQVKIDLFILFYYLLHSFHLDPFKCVCRKELRSFRQQKEEEGAEKTILASATDRTNFIYSLLGCIRLRIMYLHMPIHDGVRIQVKSAC